MASSDENFAWTDASTDSDSDTMNMEVTRENGGDDSESGHSYKKKIQKELFKNKQIVKEEPSEKKKSKKRKHGELDGSVLEEPERKLIKLEPESDIDVSKKKKKSKSCDSTLEEEEFLNFKVKEEQFSTEENLQNVKKKKKKKHRRDSQESAVGSSLRESQSVLIENSQCENSVLNESELSQEDNQQNIKEEHQKEDHVEAKKKKSKKKKKERELYENTIIEEKFSAEETIVEERVPINNQADSTIVETSRKDNSLSWAETEQQIYEDSDNSSVDNHHNSVGNTSSNQVNSNTGKSKKGSVTTDKVIAPQNSKNELHRVSNISDRIRFEEDVLDFSRDEDHDNGHLNGTETSKQIKRFLKKNSHLKQISPSVQSDSVITEDDEVWVLKCPSEVDINSLKGTNLVLDSKCKLKADSQTYVGSIENNTNVITVLTLDHGKPIIKNVSLSGTVNFRKRIPKPHYFEDNVMENNLSNFIPLPETKSRHPLFGANYKSAIKVPKHIAQRLNEVVPESTSNANGNRKKKKKHKKEPVSENEDETRFESGSTEVRKKRKRKHSVKDVASPKLAKKFKYDPDSAEAWESEKAIEQQLFNF
ncbi:myb-like protein X [Battus philenor]|uniref:myb-like protein X n=1 Tax=Battus philenor TaxID=42288 RepID=UPI0035CE9467